MRAGETTQNKGSRDSSNTVPQIATGLTIPINLYHVPVSERQGNTNSQASGIGVVKQNKKCKGKTLTSKPLQNLKQPHTAVT